MTPIVLGIVVLVIIIVLSSLARTVPQATVAVVTVFGKYRRVMREGLSFKMPWEAVSHRLSLQNRALQLEFQAITQDQANVKFATMVLYAVAGSDEEAIKKAVFSFDSSLRLRSSRTFSACAPRSWSTPRRISMRWCWPGATSYATYRLPT